MAYRGLTVELPLGQGGLISAERAGQAPPDTLLEATNIRYDEGLIRKEGGAVKLKPDVLVSGTTRIEAGWDWWPNATTQMEVVLAAEGTLAALYVTTVSPQWTAISGAFVIGGTGMFVEGGSERTGQAKKLFFFVWGAPSLVVSGAVLGTTTLGGTAQEPPYKSTVIETGQAGLVPVGTYSYLITFVTAGGETTAGTPSDPVAVTTTGGGKTKLQSIPLGGSTVTGRKIYRSNNGPAAPFGLVGTILDNTTTEFFDNTAALGAVPPATNTTNGRPAEWAGTNWPICGAIHEGRLWAGGAPNQPHRIWFSTPTDHENFMSQGAGSLEVYPGEGQNIVGMVSFNGLLIVWKYPKGIYAIDTRNVTVAQWRIDRFSSSFGGVSNCSQVMVENDVMFLDSNGEIQMLSAVQEFSNLGGQSLSKTLQLDAWIRSHVELGNLFFAKMAYYARKRELHIAVPAIGSGANNIRIVIDGNQPDRPRARVSTRDVCQSLWIANERSLAVQQQRLLSGDNTGLVWIMDQTATNKGGAGYEGKFRTMWTDLSFHDPELSDKVKHAQFIRLFFRALGQWPVTVKVWWDGEVVDTLTLNMPAAPTDPFVPLSRRFKLSGSGEQISLEVSNPNAGQDFAIARARLSFTVGAEA